MECGFPSVILTWFFQGVWRGGPEIFHLVFRQNICLVTFMEILTVVFNIKLPIDKYFMEFLWYPVHSVGL